MVQVFPSLCLMQHRVGFPDASLLPNDDKSIPFHIIGDDAFALKTWLMKPYGHQSQVYEEKIFSYRLSRARRVVENAFSLMQARFRVFGTPMLQRPDVAKSNHHVWVCLAQPPIGKVRIYGYK